MNECGQIVVVMKIFWGDPREKICEAIDKIPLSCLVIGNRGLGKLKRLDFINIELLIFFFFFKKNFWYVFYCYSVAFDYVGHYVKALLFVSIRSHLGFQMLSIGKFSICDFMRP